MSEREQFEAWKEQFSDVWGLDVAGTSEDVAWLSWQARAALSVALGPITTVTFNGTRNGSGIMHGHPMIAFSINDGPEQTVSLSGGTLTFTLGEPVTEVTNISTHSDGAKFYTIGDFTRDVPVGTKLYAYFRKESA